MSHWQPIDTAPKDGRTILVHDEGAVFIAWFEDTENAWMDVAGAAGHQRVEPAPTHWMPLPDPPAAVGEGAPAPQHAITCPQHEWAQRHKMSDTNLWGDVRCNCGVEGAPADPPATHLAAAERRIASLCDAHEEAFLRAEAAEARLAFLHSQLEQLGVKTWTSRGISQWSDQTEKWIRASDLRALLDNSENK